MNTNILNVDSDDLSISTLDEQILVLTAATLVLLSSLLLLIYKKYLVNKQKPIDNKKFNTAFLFISVGSTIIFIYIVYMNYRNLNIISKNPKSNPQFIKRQKEQLSAKLTALIASLLELDVAFKAYKNS